ncbi:MAG: hypothetical protein II038_12625 [Lachnospiraceae bacterium]|nr:hypothetical protein [Lachnospiraceae bacterium]
MKKKFSDGTVRGPYTNAELFELTNNALREQGLLPTILDYGLAESEKVVIDTYEWDVIGIPNFGGSEGIYLDLYADGIVTRQGEKTQREHVHLGTYKTLGRSKADFLEMCRLLTEFVFYLTNFCNKHMDRFTWIGYDVRFLDENEKCMYGYSEVKTVEKCRECFDKARAYNPKMITHAIVINNANGEAIELRPEEEAQA